MSDGGEVACVSGRVRRMVESWRGRVPDEFGACHIVVSDFNVGEYHLGYCAGVADEAEEYDCGQFVLALSRLEACERFAVVLLLAGQSESSLLEG